VGLGGFKLMYPLFEKSLSSNLESAQKSQIWIYLLKILRIMMNIEPGHIYRLYKNKNLISILKYCFMRAGHSKPNLLTKDFLQQVMKIVNDIRENASNRDLEDFYKRFLYDIILSESFCALRFSKDSRLFDRGSNNLLFSEVADRLYDSFTKAANQKQLMAQKKSHKGSQDHIQTIVANEECFRILVGLLRKFAQPENLRQLNKIARVLIRVIVMMDYKEGLQDIIQEITQLSGEISCNNRSLLKVLLKILAGVITDKEFLNLPSVFQAFKSARSLEKLWHNFTLNIMYPLSENEKLRDSIIASTFRVLFNHFLIMFYEPPRMQLPNRPMQASEKARHEDKPTFLKKAFDQIKKN